MRDCQNREIMGTCRGPGESSGSSQVQQIGFSQVQLCLWDAGNTGNIRAGWPRRRHTNQHTYQQYVGILTNVQSRKMDDERKVPAYKIYKMEGSRTILGKMVINLETWSCGKLSAKWEKQAVKEPSKMPTPWSPASVNTLLCIKRGFANVIKGVALRWGHCPGFSAGPNIITLALQNGDPSLAVVREKRARRESKCERFVTHRCCLWSWRKETISPGMQEPLEAKDSP